MNGNKDILVKAKLKVAVPRRKESIEVRLNRSWDNEKKNHEEQGIIPTMTGSPECWQNKET